MGSPDAAAPGLLERVLDLKAIPALATLHPDDLVGLARAAAPCAWGAGEQMGGPAETEAGACFLFDGAARGRHAPGDDGCRAAPCIVGLAEALAGVPAPELVAEGDTSGLVVCRAALLDVLEDEFELWRAALRELCRDAVRAGLRLGVRDGRGLPAATGPLDLATRIQLLRGSTPFRGAGVHLLGQIAIGMSPVEHARGDRLWDTAEPARAALLVVEGSVAVEAASGTSVEPPAGPGSLLGLAEALGGERFRRRAAASEALRGLRIDTEDLIDVLEDDPENAVDLLCAIAREMVREAPHAEPQVATGRAGAADASRARGGA